MSVQSLVVIFATCRSISTWQGHSLGSTSNANAKKYAFSAQFVRKNSSEESTQIISAWKISIFKSSSLGRWRSLRTWPRRWWWTRGKESSSVHASGLIAWTSSKQLEKISKRIWWSPGRTLILSNAFHVDLSLRDSIWSTFACTVRTTIVTIACRMPLTSTWKNWKYSSCLDTCHSNSKP